MPCWLYLVLDSRGHLKLAGLELNRPEGWSIRQAGSDLDDWAWICSALVPECGWNLKACISTVRSLTLTRYSCWARHRYTACATVQAWLQIQRCAESALLIPITVCICYQNRMQVRANGALQHAYWPLVQRREQVATIAEGHFKPWHTILDLLSSHSV